MLQCEKSAIQVSEHQRQQNSVISISSLRKSLLFFNFSRAS